MKRRKILGAIGSGTIGIGAMSIGSAAESSEQRSDESTTLIDLEGQDRRSVMRQVYSDPDFQAVVGNVRSKGWTLDWFNPTVRRVSIDGEGKYDFVVMAGTPGKLANTRSELIAFWIGDTTVDLDFPTHTGAHLVRTNDDVNTASESQSGSIFGYS